MDINKLNNAFKGKYELYDINHKRLLPKEIVAFRKQSSLDIGVVITVNPKTTTVISLKDKNKTFAIYPNEQVIITSMMDNKQTYFNLFDQIIEKRKQKTFLRYICGLLVDKTKEQTDIEKYHLIIFKYLLNVGNNSAKSWNNYIENIKQNKLLDLTNKDLYIFCNDDMFYEIDQIKYKDINYISNDNKGYLLSEQYGIDRDLNDNNFVMFPIDKDCVLYFKPFYINSFATNIKSTIDNKYKIPQQPSYLYNVYVKCHNFDKFYKGLTVIRNKYEH